MRLKFENLWNEDEYTWEVVHDDTHFEAHAEPYIHRTFEEWSREYEPILTTHWEVNFVSPMDSITVNNIINQVGR